MTLLEGLKWSVEVESEASAIKRVSSLGKLRKLGFRGVQESLQISGQDRTERLVEQQAGRDRWLVEGLKCLLCGTWCALGTIHHGSIFWG